MSIELVRKNVVILAQQFNPSILTQLWLVKNGVLAEDEFETGCIFTESLVQVIGKRFNITAIPNQFQFMPVPSIPSDEERDLISEKVGLVVTRLPHTPYTALGFNFVWHAMPEHETTKDFCRRMFFRDDGPLFREFRSEDALFGAYMSKDLLGFRMKMDVWPGMTSAMKDLQLQIAFNFHVDLTNDESRIEKLVKMLGQWEQARSESLRIVKSISDGS